MSFATLLYQERLPAHPYDQLLAAGVLLTAFAIPLVVKLGSSMQQKQTQRLRAEFGPEYERAVNEHGDWRKAEAELRRRMRSQARVKPTDTP